MKLNKLLLIAIVGTMLTGCNDKGSSSVISSSQDETTSSSNEQTQEEILKTALASVGTNYTVTWSCLTDDDDYSPMKLFGEGFMAQKLMYQLVGYGKVAKDDNKYHGFDHYNPDRIDPNNGEYFILQGRRDYDDEQLKEDANIASFFDLEKFDIIDDTHYRSKDEMNTVKYLNDINTAIGYYMFGNGHEGVEIVLTDDYKLKEINWYGIGDEDTGEQTSTDIWAKATYTNIGSTTDEIFFNYVDNEENIPTPTYDDLGIVCKSGVAAYEGTEQTFENMVVSSNVAGYIGLVSVDNPYDGFASKETTTLNGYIGKQITFKATISTVNGHVELTNVKDIEVNENEAELTSVWVEDGESYYYDFADREYGVRNSGSFIDLYNASYKGYSVTDSALVLDFAYLCSGKNYMFKLTIPSTNVASLKTTWEQKLEDDEISVNDWCDIPVGLFVYEGNDAVVYINEADIGDIARATNFNDLCYQIVGMTIPVSEDLVGFEFFCEAEFYSADGENTYPGVLAIADVYEDKVDTYVETYKAMLNIAGFTLVTDYEDEGVEIVQYNKDNVAVMFTSPSSDDGNYYYTQLQVIDLSTTISE